MDAKEPSESRPSGVAASTSEEPVRVDTWEKTRDCNFFYDLVDGLDVYVLIVSDIHDTVLCMKTSILTGLVL